MNRPTRRSRRRKANAVPDRWLDYSNSGNRIPGTRFVCMKVPLKPELCRLLTTDEQFTPADVVQEMTKRGVTMGMLVDLTNTDRYYNPKEVEDFGIIHSKIMVRGHEVPSYNEIKRFFDVVDQFENEQKGKEGESDSVVIGVHCTHGVNRTGYLVCRYLIDRKGWSAERAVTEFNLARGHNIERENYLQALTIPPEVCLQPRSALPNDDTYNTPRTSWRGDSKMYEDYHRDRQDTRYDNRHHSDFRFFPPRPRGRYGAVYHHPYEWRNDYTHSASSYRHDHALQRNAPHDY